MAAEYLNRNEDYFGEREKKTRYDPYKSTRPIPHEHIEKHNEEELEAFHAETEAITE